MMKPLDFGVPDFQTNPNCSTWLPGLENKQVAIENGHLVRWFTQLKNGGMVDLSIVMETFTSD